MAQKNSNWINLIINFILSILITLIGAIVVGFATNKLSEGENYKNVNLLFLLIFLAFLASGVQGISKAIEEDDLTSKRRQLLISVTSILIGGGGSLFFLSKLVENIAPSESKVVSPSPPSTTPTQKPTPITPKSKPTPSVETNISKLVKDSFPFETVEVNERGDVIKRESKTTSMWIEDLGGGIKLEMVYIPGGTFTMGSPENEEGHRENKQISEDQKHNIAIQPILMGRYAVTQSQWKSVSKLARVQIDLDSDPSYFKGARHPVERITWDEAKEFCERLSNTTGREYRLPTEAEWEYACRANTTTPFYFGNTITTDLANYDGSTEAYGQGPQGQYRRQTTEVGIFPPNAYGLFDMHGNLWEWCADNWSMDGKFFNIIRGGSWYTSPKRCRSANRTILRLNNRENYAFQDSVGFRVVYVPKIDIFQ